MKPLKDYSWVRGVNYYQCEEEQLRRELGYGKRVNLNAVRIWLSRNEYEKSKGMYLAKLINYVRVCYDCGYQVMPILFNGNMLDPDTLTPEQYARNDEYAEAVVKALRNEDGLLIWDVMNEPFYNEWILDPQASEAEVEERRQITYTFIRRYCDFVRKCDPINALTVGFAMAEENEPVIDCVDAISFHDYSATRKAMHKNFGNAKALSEKYGKPAMQTETGCLARCNPYDMVLQACDEYQMGWFVFELIIHGRCDTEHGVFYPDGTVRDPGTISAMMGCYRSRDLNTIIVPIPNREGQAAECVEDIKAALTEYTRDVFDYRQSNVDALLLACERAANLLECCDMIPMALPPTAKVFAWRKMENPPLGEIRAFAYDLALKLKEICQLL